MVEDGAGPAPCPGIIVEEPGIVEGDIRLVGDILYAHSTTETSAAVSVLDLEVLQADDMVAVLDVKDSIAIEAIDDSSAG